MDTTTPELYTLSLHDALPILTADEVRAVHDGAIEANAGRSLLTAGVGRSLKEAIELGRRARDKGADALMAHQPLDPFADRKSTRLNSSHLGISYAVFCLKKKI